MASTDVIQTTVTTTNVPANNDNDIAIKARPELSSPLTADTPTPPASNSSIACHSISDIDTCNATASVPDTCKESHKDADATSKSQQASDKQEQSTSAGSKDTKSSNADTNNNANQTKSIRRLAAHRPEPLKLIPTSMKLRIEKSNIESSAATLANTSSSAPAATTTTAIANGSCSVRIVGDKPLDLSVRGGDNVPLSALAKLGFPPLGSSGSGCTTTTTTTTTTSSNLFSSVGSSGTIGTTPSCGQQSTLETPRIVWQDNESLFKNQANNNSHHNHHNQHQQWFNSTSSSRSRHQSTNRFSSMFGTPSTSTPPLTPNTPLTASQQLNSSGNLSSLSCFLAQLSPHSLSASSPLLPQLSATSSNSCESALSSASSTCSASQVGFSCSKEGVAALGALNSPLGPSSSHLLQLHQHQHQLHQSQHQLHQSQHSLRDLPQLHLTNQHHNQQHPQHLSTSSSSLAGLLTPSYFRHYELASCLPSPLFATTASSSGSATGSAKVPGDGGTGRVVAGAFFAPSDPLPAVFQDINHQFSISKKTKSPSTQSSSLLPPTTVQSTIANLHNIHLSSPTELSGSLMTPNVVGVTTTRSTTIVNDYSTTTTTQTNCQQSLDTPKIEQHNNSFNLALASPLLQAPTLVPTSPVTSYNSQAANESNQVPSSRATKPPPTSQQQQLASLVTSAKHKQQPLSSIQDIEMDVDVDEIADDAAAQAEIKLVLESVEPTEDSIDVDTNGVHQQRATSASASTDCLHTVTETGIPDQPVITSQHHDHQQQTMTTIQPLNHQLHRSASTVPLIYVSKQQQHQQQQQKQQQQQQQQQQQHPEVHVTPTSCQHQQLQLHLSGSSWHSSNAQSSTSCDCCCFSCNSLINFNQLNQFCPQQQQQLQQHVVAGDTQHNVTDVSNSFHTTVNESRQYRCARLDSCSAPPPQLPHSGRATPIRANLNSSGQSIVNYQHNQKQQLNIGSRVMPTSASNSNCSYSCSCNDELESLGTCGLPSSSSNCALYCAPSSSPAINTPTAYASNSMSCLQVSGIQNVGLNRNHHSQNQDLQRLQPVTPTSERHFVSSNCNSPRRPLVASTGNLALPVRRSQPHCQQQLLQLHNQSASQLLAIPTTATSTSQACVPRSASDDCSLFTQIGNQNRSASATLLTRHHTNIVHHRPRPLSSSSLTSPTNSASGNNLFMSSSRKYRCFQCNKSFARSDMLTRHQRLHSGIRPFRCNQCKQEFSRSDHLSTHMRTHTGEKPYRCKLCSYVACRKDMITRHMKVHVGMTKQQTQIQLQQLHSNNNTTSNNHNIQQQQYRLAKGNSNDALLC